jgi:hypothetical protein
VTKPKDWSYTLDKDCENLKERILSCVGSWKSTDVSEEYVAFIFRVEV